MSSTDSANTISKPDKDWTPGYLVDNIFVDLMENGHDENTNSNKYILQLTDKFTHFRIKSDFTLYDISFNDLSLETTDNIRNYTKDCKSPKEKHQRLDWVIVDVIARIAKQAESRILSLYPNEDQVMIKVRINEIRELVSHRWRFI
jgi:hypothetical protein